MVAPLRALNRKLLRDILHIRTQALAIAVVIAAGIAVFVMSQGTIESLTETRAAYYEQQRFAQVFAQVKRAPRSLEPRIAAIPGVSHVELRVVFGVTLDIAGMAEPAIGRLISLPETREPSLNTLYLRRGRSIEPGRSHEVVASQAFASAHGFEPGDELVAVVNGRRQRLEIVGIALSPEYVYSIAPGAILPDDRRFGILWIGERSLSAMTDLEGAFNDISLSLTATASEPEVLSELDRLLAPYGGLGAYGRPDQPSHWYVSGELDQLRIMAFVSPVIFLSVAVFLLHVVMSRLIATEREQIGTLKACGYSDLQIGMHYLKLAFLIVGAGVVLGTTAGTALGRDLTETYTRFYQFPLLVYRLTPEVVAMASLISAMAAMAGTLGAVRQAAILPPAEAMRPEQPPTFRRTVVERFGLQTFLATPTRIVLRQIERRPVRSLLSCLGIAMAVAVLIAALFVIDAIDYVMRTQFEIAQRQDMTITFVEPRAGRAALDIGHLPGVSRVEPFRAVPARLRSGHLEERVALTGLVPSASLNRMIDSSLRPVEVPDHGVMLSKKLAELLDLRPGQELIAEALEGRQTVARLRVAGIFEEFIGTSAFMNLPALNEFMQEGATISGAHLLVDSAAMDELYQELKGLPAVASVAMRRTMFESFEETIKEHILRIVLFNAGFAGLIALGIVYNSARISLSERARELASLRILGFTQAEVAYILLGEFVILTLAAIPLGCLIGWGLAWLITQQLDTELYRIPLIIDRSTYGFAIAITAIAVILSATLVQRRLSRLDLVTALKARD